MASCTRPRRGMSLAGSGLLKGGRHFLPKGAVTTAGRSPIYLSEWLTHKLIKRYLETFSDETWPAVVKWTFVLGVLALRNGGIPCHCLSLADLKDIAKQNSDDCFIPSMREGLLQLVWRRDGSSSNGKEDVGSSVALHSVDAGAAAAAERGAESTTIMARTPAEVGPAEAAAADEAKTTAAAGNVGTRRTTGNGRVRGGEGGQEGERGTAAAARRGRAAGIVEATVANRRVFSSVPFPRRSTRRYFSADEKSRGCWCREPSAAEHPQKQRDCCILQKPSSIWRCGDPITFAPLRGPYRGEQLPRPQRFSKYAERTYPLWWGDFFTSATEKPPPLPAVTLSWCCSSPGTGRADAQCCEKQVLPPGTTTGQPCGKVFTDSPGADVSSSPSMEQQQQQMLLQEQQQPRDSRLQVCTREEAAPTLFLGDHYSKQGQEAFEEGEEVEEMTTAATAAATPKFGAPAPPPAVAVGERAASPQKQRPHSKVNSACRAAVARARSREGQELLLSPKCRPSCASLASPLSLAASLQDTNQFEQQEQEAPRDHAQQQCPGKRPHQRQGMLHTCGKQQPPQCRRGYAPLLGLQQQHRLRQRALHRSVAAAPHVVVDGFQSFRPAGEARWICTLRPAAHRHMRPQPPIASACTRRQPILPPLAQQTSTAAGRSSSGKRGVVRSVQQQQVCQQHLLLERQQMQLHAHHTQPGFVHTCRVPLPNLEERKTDLLTIGELSRAALPPDWLQEPPVSGRLHSSACHSLTSRATTPAAEPHRVGRLAAAVGAARAAALDATCAIARAAAAAAEKPCTVHCVGPGNEQAAIKQTEHDAPLLRTSDTSSNACNYSSFFDAALAVYTNATTANASKSPCDILLEPHHQRPYHQLRTSFCPTNAMPDHYSHADNMATAREGLRAPEAQPVVTGFATSDAAKCTSNRRCSTSESSFSLSSLSVAEQSAGASPDLQTACTYPASAAAAQERYEPCSQRHSTQTEKYVNQEERMVKQMHLPSQRAGTSQQLSQVQQALERGKTDGHGEAHTATGSNMRHVAAKDPGLHLARSDVEEEAATVRELLQLYFPPDTERAAVSQQRRSCAVPMPADAGWKRRQLLQQSF